jgi:lactate permease
MIEVLLALLPILLIFVLMVFFKLPALKAMPPAFFLGLAIAAFYWHMPGVVLAAATMKGILVALEIMLIIIGAIFLLEVLKQGGLIEHIDHLLMQITHDRRIHAILIAWSFGCFMEGAAGFGTPQALAAPLLVGLGIAAFPAVVAATLANSSPVSFGAIGTPILVGIGTTISPDRAFLHELSIYVAIIHAVIALFVPVLIACMMTKLGPEKSFKKGLEVWEFAVFAGACFAVPYLIMAICFGPEFPTITGGLLGFIVLIFCAKQGFLIPHHLRPRKKTKIELTHLLALLPYVFVGLVLFVTRVPAINKFLKQFAFKFTNIFGTNITQDFYYLISPGIIFIITAGLTLFFIKESKSQIYSAAKTTAKKSIYALIALSFTVALVQLFIASGTNNAGLPSMPVAVAKEVAAISGQSFIFFSPIIGAFGAFIAGSNTVSNLLFASFQHETALALGLPVIIILALQVVGGAVGNMIAIHNIIAASATVDLKHEEGRVIRTNIVPVLIYCLIASIMGFIMIKILV